MFLQDISIFRQRELHSSIFGFNNLLTLVSYVCKRNKAVILLSTVNHDDTIDEDEPHLPEIIQLYNLTKGGVDTLNKKLKHYSTKRKINRWPMTVFFNILDVCAFGSFIIWSEDHQLWNENSKDKRRLYLKVSNSDRNF